jgi:hypothetical protein
MEALAKIRARVTAGDDDDDNNDASIWRYATATGTSDNLLSEGWFVES